MSKENQNSSDGSVSSEINAIFDSPRIQKIFRDREALSENHPQNKFPFRKTEILSLVKILAPALEGWKPSSVLITGPIGTGKTDITKYVLSLLEQKAKENNSDASVQSCYVNCRILGSASKIIVELCSKLGIDKTTKIPSNGISFEELLSRFAKGVDSEKRIVIIVLDEIDTFVKDRGCNLIYDLTRMTLAKSKLSIIGIGNNPALEEWIDAKTSSSLHAERIEFKPYDAEQIKSILSERAESAFQKGVLREEVVPLCAALTANGGDGDIRVALTFLSVAAEYAVRDNASLVTEDYVKKAKNNIEHDRTIVTLQRLSSQEKLIILGVLSLDEADGESYNNGGFPIGKLYHRYQEICRKLVMDPLTQRRILQLVSQLAAGGLLNTHVVSFGRGGRMTKVRSEIHRTVIETALKQDDLVGSLICNKGKLLFYT